MLNYLILICGLATIFSDKFSNRKYFYILKPLTTILIIVLAYTLEPTYSVLYKNLLIVGLIFSLLGDIFLMSERFFLPGLISFLITHLLYIGIFKLETAIINLAWIGIPLIIVGGVFYKYLYSHLGDLKIPVLIYLSVIVLMGWQAIQLNAYWGAASTLLAMVGSILFMISDASLALNRFVKPLPQAQFIVLGTYYLAQWCIANSI
ncbi:MAG: lysoplasmalogenase [Candidatus Marinimicrobia bacterium]|nr:lysoplasmalogenase [Candidatus Neomarinimicrobiota bacterium]